MKKHETDLALELEELLDEYNLNKEADVRFLLRRMLNDNDPRYSDCRKKADRVRKAYREGRLKNKETEKSGLA